jgi:uncharacterized membrane protein/Mg-chelatase subunit ChlD
MNLSDYNAGDLLWLGDWSPAWIAVLIVVGALVIGISIYDLRPMPRVRRWTLVTLRTLVYGLAVMLLLEPAVDLKNVTKVKNHVAVMVDTSTSMSLDAGDGTRWENAREAVEQLELPDEMEDEDHVYDLWEFGDTAEQLTSRSLKSAEPTRGGTHIAGALDTVVQNYERVDVGGVVLITDGTDTGAFGERTRRGQQLDDTSRDIVRSVGAPVHTVRVASSQDLVDVAITRVLRDDFAFVHNKTSIEVEVQAVGLEPTSFPVKLIREGELLQTREVTVVEGQDRYELEFEYVPETIGKEIYTLELPEFSDEVLTTNNRSHFLQKVIRDKIRALQVVGRPSWDERFLRRLLKRNPNVDLISFFILRTNENVQMAPTSELSLIPFPTEELFQEELGSFDLVIFQNFNFAPYNMRQYLPEISKFVKDGGGFAMVGGDLSFASGGYSQTPIEEVLPVHLPPRGTRPLIDETPFRPRLTESGERHPITQLAFDPSSNRRLWEKLPMQKGTNLVLGAKEHSTVLAEHPTLTADGDPMPVITVAEMGDGRVMALTTDSTWRWGFEHLGQGGTPREYQVFWNSAIRWLIKDPELKLLKVEIGADDYAPGEVLEATVRIQKSDYTPAPNIEGEAVISRRSFEALATGSDDRTIVDRQKFTTRSDGTANLEIPVDREGVWEVSAHAQTSAGDLRDGDVTLVVVSAEELRDVLPREDLLDSIATAADGQAVDVDEVGPETFNFAEPRTVRVNRRTVIQLWDSFAVFAIILVLLGAEWTLRRRWGRL